MQQVKDMKKFLGNPATLQELYVAVTTKLTSDELYDLLSDERGQLNKLKFSINEIDKSYERGEYYHYLAELFRQKSTIDESIVNHINNYENTDAECDKYFGSKEQEKQQKREENIKRTYKNLIYAIYRNRKKLSIEDTKSIEEITRRMRQYSKIESNSIAGMFSLLEKYIRSDESPLSKALLTIGEIHGEDISRPLLTAPDGDDTLLKGTHVRDGLALTGYVYDVISFEDLIKFLTQWKKHIEESILRHLQKSLPTISYLSALLQKVNGTKVTGLIATTGNPKDIVLSKEMDINFDEIQKLEKEFDAIKLILETDPTEVETSLKPFKDMIRPKQEIIFEKEMPEMFQLNPG